MLYSRELTRTDQGKRKLEEEKISVRDLVGDTDNRFGLS